MTCKYVTLINKYMLGSLKVEVKENQNYFIKKQKSLSCRGFIRFSQCYMSSRSTLSRAPAPATEGPGAWHWFLRSGGGVVPTILGMGPGYRCRMHFTHTHTHTHRVNAKCVVFANLP